MASGQNSQLRGAVGRYALKMEKEERKSLKLRTSKRSILSESDTCTLKERK